MKIIRSVAPVALLIASVVSFAAPAQAGYGDPLAWITVSTDDAGPATDLTVTTHRFDRVVLEFDGRVKWWHGHRLVFHANAGNDSFGARYLVHTADGWERITKQITSDGGFIFGRCDTASVRIRLVVTVETMYRWGAEYKRRFTVTEGREVGGETVWASALIRTDRF